METEHWLESNARFGHIDRGFESFEIEWT